MDASMQTPSGSQGELPASRWRCGMLTASDRDDMLALFAAAFGSELDLALWRWKYEAGGGSASGVWDDKDRLVGHYAGFPRAASMFGKPVAARQIGDVMVEPSARGTLSRKGPHFLSAIHYLEREVGYGKPALLAFGFPNDRAMRVAARLQTYGDCGRMNAYVWPSADASLPWWLRLRRFEASGRWSQAVDQLWRDMSSGLHNEIVCVRDAKWVEYRFLQRPGGDYELHWVSNRVTGKPIALLIFRKAEGRVDLLDLVAAPKHWDVCVTAARRLAADRGQGDISLWATVPFATFSKTPAETRDLGITVPNCICTEGPSTESQRDRWFLTGGDTDFL